MGLKDLKPNVPKVNIAEYVIVLGGKPKVGKTTFFYNLLVKYLKDASKGLLLAAEPGYKALPGIYAQDFDDWSEFVECVDELIDEKDELPFKLIGIDTIDALTEMAGRQAVKEYNRTSPTQRVKAYADIPYGKGHENIKVMIEEQITRLRKAGYGLFIITHSVEKKVKQKDGLEYDQLQASLPGKIGTIIQNAADFIMFATTNRNKDGEVERQLVLRDDGYVAAGGRFQDLPDKINMDVDEFVKAFEHAVVSAVKAAGIKEKDIAKLEEEQENIRQAQAEDARKLDKLAKEPKELQDLIIAKVSSMDKDHQDVVIAKFKEITGGQANPKKIDDPEVLLDMLKACN